MVSSIQGQRMLWNAFNNEICRKEHVICILPHHLIGALS